MNAFSPLPSFELDDKILRQGAEISRKLNQLRLENFPPNAKKTLRPFSVSEVAHYLGVTPSNLKRLYLDKKGPLPTTLSGNRKFYTADQMLELRHYLAETGKSEAKRYLPHRKPGTSSRS